MNYVCDKEANKAVEKSIQHRFLVEEKQPLSGENAAVFVGGKKLTSGLSSRGFKHPENRPLKNINS